jgi:hypothetical protein
MMWGSFPWPVLFVISVMIAMVVFVALRSGFGRGSMGPGCGFRRAPGPPRRAGEAPGCGGSAGDTAGTLRAGRDRQGRVRRPAGRAVAL